MKFLPPEHIAAIIAYFAENEYEEFTDYFICNNEKNSFPGCKF